MPQIIEVTVSPQGETTVQTKGFTGSTCQEASKFLEQALGVLDRRTEDGRILCHRPSSAADSAVGATDNSFVRQPQTPRPCLGLFHVPGESQSNP